ncbi:MAG: DegV family protein [Candidatus Paceibacterota bacterium]
MSIKIIVGESAPTTPDIVAKYGFATVPFKIDWPEFDTIKGNTLFQKMREAKKQGIKTTPKTSQPSIGIYKKAFDEALVDNEYILAITISSGISGTYNSAIQAKKMFSEDAQKKIYVFDTFNADAAESLFAIKAGDMAVQEKTIDEVMAKLEELKPSAKLYGFLDDPYWLEAGGRISHAVAVIMAQMQKIGMRPLLSMKDGVVKPANLKMQAKDTADALFKQLESIVKDPLADGKKVSVAISHADNPGEAENLKKMIEEKYPSAKIEFVTETGPVIGAHIGPGSLICCCLID